MSCANPIPVTHSLHVFRRYHNCCLSVNRSFAQRVPPACSLCRSARCRSPCPPCVFATCAASKWRKRVDYLVDMDHLVAVDDVDTLRTTRDRLLQQRWLVLELELDPCCPCRWKCRNINMYLSSVHACIPAAPASTPTPTPTTEFQHCECTRRGCERVLFDSPERGDSHQQAFLTEYLQGADVSGGNGSWW
jgi:hypothetical protein